MVIALGGNAIIKERQRGTVYEQFANSRESLKEFTSLVKEGHELVLTHGNGPQVGNILIRVENAREEAYELPLGVCVAESQGEMGYMLAQTLKNFLHLEGLPREVVAVLTQVIVDRYDPATIKPTKPIGPFLTEDQARHLTEQGVPVIEDSGRGRRRIVPSPVPKKVVEGKLIKRLLDQGVLVVACGGGGMPVYLDDKGCLEGVDAVVDKDLASAQLALEVGATDLIILTSVERVCLYFGEPNQRALDHLTLDEAKRFLAEGHFAPGSMGPKIAAAIRFLEEGGERGGDLGRRAPGRCGERPGRHGDRAKKIVTGAIFRNEK